MLDKMNVTRRGLMQGAGALTLTFSLSGPTARTAAAQGGELPGNLADNPMLSSWISVHEDDSVTLMMGKVELGQGTVTSAAMIAADELYVDLGNVEVISGDTWLSPNEGTTAGSGSAPGCMPEMSGITWAI